MANILIVDDEQGYCKVLKVVFEKEGYAVATANSGEEAVEHIQNEHCDLIISDVKMPDMNGIGLLKAARDHSDDIRIILMTAFGTLETAREAFKLGADDFIQKPFQNDELKLIVKRTLEKQEIITENRAFKRVQRATGSVDNIVGESEKMQKLFEMIKMVAKENSTVLLTGESGTGKELTARAIHDASERAEKPFVPINCGAIPDHLLESELFGFMKGTFTDAKADRIGLFAAANGGTILLDEIGDMPLAMQVKILRVLQDRNIRPVGATVEIPLDVRFIAATNTDINKKIEDGTFRQDLFYRLSVMPIDLPPLRERIDDIPALAEYFIRRFSKHSGKKVELARDALKTLKTRAWKGNVRELEHVIERAVALTPDNGEILPEHVSDQSRIGNSAAFTLPSDGMHLQNFMNDLEKQLVTEAYSRADGNQARAAEFLQMPVHAFRHLISKHELQQSEGKEKAAEA